MPPIDLAESPADAAQMEQMRQEQPIAPEPAAQPDSAKAEPEVAKAPEAAKEEPTKEPEKGEGREVPLPALLAERRAKKAAQEALKEAQEALAELRKGILPNPEAPAHPDAQTDPIAVIERLEKRIADQDKRDDDSRRMGEFQQTVIQKEQEFVKENPDYPKAVEFLKEARVKELRDGLGLNDQQIAQALAQEAAQTAAYALQNDLNPAEVFMRLAKVRGFGVPPLTQPENPAEQPVHVDPAALAKLRSLEKGMQAGKSVSNGGGGAALPAPSLEAIANLEGADFDAAWKSGKVKELMN